MNIDILAKLLREHMNRNTLSTRDVSDETGLSHTTIVHILQGRTVNMRTLKKIAQWLQVSSTDITGPKLDTEDEIVGAVTALIRQEPALAEALGRAVERMQAGEISPDVVRDVVRYAVWRLGNGSDQKGGEEPRRVSQSG